MGGPEVHRILRRQLARLGATDLSSAPAGGEPWVEFVERVSRTYAAADDDRYTLERSLEISSREMAELHQRLAQERDSVSSVLRALPTCVVLLDPGGTVRLANPAAQAMLGEAIVGASLFDLLALRNAQGVLLVLPLIDEALRAGGSLRDHDAFLLRPGCDDIPIQYEFTPMRRENVYTGCVLTLIDLSAQKRTERALRDAQVEAELAQRAEAQRGQFLAHMSHELRTPLNTIIGYSEMLAEELEPDSTSHADVERVLGSARHLLGLINDILDLSKIDAGRMELHIEPFRMAPLLEEVAASARVLAARNGNKTELSIDPKLGVVHLDMTKLRQCLLNLVSNAAKFTRVGRIRIQAVVDGDLLRIDVSDTGIGIPEDKLRRLFQPFTQADNATAKEYGGTGLGLTLTRLYVEMMGGVVEVKSSPGTGSVFTLRLPIRAEPPTAIIPGGVRWTSGEGSDTLLVVDDDRAVFDIIARMVAREGCQVVGVPTAEQTLSTAIELSPFAIVLDVVLPGINGWMALRALRDNPITANIPVIMVTTSEDGRRIARDMRAEAFMCKPIDLAALLQMLRDFRAKRDRPPLSQAFDAAPLSRRG